MDSKDYEAARQKPMQLIRIGTDLKMTKETIKAGVFRPWWNLPTRSMEDYAEEELHHMQEAEAARAAEEKPDRRYKQLEEEGLEDDEELVDRATYKYVMMIINMIINMIMMNFIPLSTYPIEIVIMKI